MITIKTAAIYILFFASLLLTGCTSQSKTSESITKNPEVKQETLFAIQNVNIIPMTVDNTVIENATIVIDNKKIVAINEAIPEGAKIIDGTNKWLLPGLIDMHVHTNSDVNFKGNKPTQGATVFMDTQEVMTTHVANGVTTIFELGARVEHFGQRNDIAKGKVIGPRMALAALINGGDPNEGGRTVTNESDARQAVRSAKAEGYNFIKVYSQLNRESFAASIDEAEKQGLKVVGHIPDAFRGRTEEAFVPNFSLVAHAEEFSKQIRNEDKTIKEAIAFAQMAKNNNTWVIPNLIAIVKIRDQVQSLDSIRFMKTLKYVHPILQDKWLTSNNYNKHSSPEFLTYLDSLISFHKKLVKAFKEKGVPMVAGTDAGTSGIVTGFALHDELSLLVNAGLTPEETLVSATRLPAEWLDIDKETGTVEVGKHADLILLDKNPLVDINNTRTINGVFVNGTWVSKKKLDTMLSELAQYNEKNKENFKWAERRAY
ncbi:amidohydrolase family protein [Aquimarina sp. W85]|uniref:amidohydrolase family protein n=1 Tax=Aquimarina rhodophyticola TaxID=3342246 RepID=UPI0036719EBF